MGNDTIIRVESLKKSFKKGHETIEVLEAIDLEVKRGEGLSIMGASGTGKSTLLHLIGGLDRVDSGRIYHQDRDICTMDERAKAAFRNRSIGFVFQFHFLMPEFTAFENVMMPSLVSTKRSTLTRQKALDLLHDVGLDHRITHKPSELSGGEQQRVAVARALMMSPTVLLADEPTGNLDPDTGSEVIRLLERIRHDHEITMIIVTHNPLMAQTMDRIVELKGGLLEPYHP
ncbi:MAG: ABC transporter ATP-binding protein [Thermodesulfobacteriota bacterium]|nr:ABC transporter ATP-binding protein [Thermodesulfobacteriota bacterium]